MEVRTLSNTNVNMISGLVALILGGLFYILTYGFPDIDTDILGPDFLPKLYSVFLVIFGLILIINAIIKKKRETAEMRSTNHSFLYGLASMLIVFIYILVLPYIGFYISTILVMLALLYFLKVRNYVILFSVSLGTITFLFIIFEKLLKVPIPSGSLFM